MIDQTAADPEPTLPSDVVEAIRANRKIDAIKLLREHWGVGLKEANESVDRHARHNPVKPLNRSAVSEGGVFRLLIAAAVVVAAYVVYRVFV